MLRGLLPTRVLLGALGAIASLLCVYVAWPELPSDEMYRSETVRNSLRDGALVVFLLITLGCLLASSRLLLRGVYVSTRATLGALVATLAIGGGAVVASEVRDNFRGSTFELGWPWSPGSVALAWVAVMLLCFAAMRVQRVRSEQLR